RLRRTSDREARPNDRGPCSSASSNGHPPPLLPRNPPGRRASAGTLARNGWTWTKTSREYATIAQHEVQTTTWLHKEWMSGRGPREGAVMGEIAYRSEVRVERVKGPLRRAYLPAETEPVAFSTHGPVAAHYKAQPGTFEPHATTLDYVVAATAG